MKMTPGIGVVLPTREALRDRSPELIGQMAIAAEDAGFDSVWAGDSLLARPLFEPLVALAGAAAVTARIRLGTGALLVPIRPPVPTAHALASLDQLSGGRLVVGAGRGFDLPETHREFAAAGVPFEARSRRLDEAVELWRTLWSGEKPVDHSSDTCALERVDLQPRPAQPGGPPILLAGDGPRAQRRVAASYDGWLPYPPSYEQYRQGWGRICELATGTGRDPASIIPAVMLSLALDESPNRAAAELEEYVASFYGYPLSVVGLLQGCFAGPPGAAVDWLRGYWDAGARHFVIRLAAVGSPLQMLQTATEVLLPAVRAWVDESVTLV